jgi:hypothetical protein
MEIMMSLFMVGKYGWESKEEYLEYVSWLTERLDEFKKYYYNVNIEFGSNNVEIKDRSGNIAHIKVFSEPSEFGIDNGRISKMTIHSYSFGNSVYSYDRGLVKNELSVVGRTENEFFTDIINCFN